MFLLSTQVPTKSLEKLAHNTMEYWVCHLCWEYQVRIIWMLFLWLDLEAGSMQLGPEKRNNVHGCPGWILALAFMIFHRRMMTVCPHSSKGGVAAVDAVEGPTLHAPARFEARARPSSTSSLP